MPQPAKTTVPETRPGGAEQQGQEILPRLQLAFLAGDRTTTSRPYPPGYRARNRAEGSPRRELPGPNPRISPPPSAPPPRSPGFRKACLRNVPRPGSGSIRKRHDRRQRPARGRVSAQAAERRKEPARPSARIPASSAIFFLMVCLHGFSRAAPGIDAARGVYAVRADKVKSGRTCMPGRGRRPLALTRFLR